MQSNLNSIADVLVGIKGCIWLWEHMNVNVDANRFKFIKLFLSSRECDHYYGTQIKRAFKDLEKGRGFSFIIIS